MDSHHRVGLSIVRSVAAPPAEAAPVAGDRTCAVVVRIPGFVHRSWRILVGHSKHLSVAGHRIVCPGADNLAVAITSDAVGKGDAVFVSKPDILAAPFTAEEGDNKTQGRADAVRAAVRPQPAVRLRSIGSVVGGAKKLAGRALERIRALTRDFDRAKVQSSPVPMRTLLTIALTTCCACGGDGSVTGFGAVTQPGVTGLPAGSESTAAESSTGVMEVDGSTSSSGSGDVSSTGSSTGAGTVWDMGVPDFGSVQPAGCQGKIDFLFAISADGTMKSKQERLVASLPGFMDAIEAQLPGFDYHILSANTDEGWEIKDCSICTEDCDPQGETPYCSAAVTACDKKIGAGVIFPTGTYAANRRCAIDSGLRYITTGQQSLDEVFTCTAQVGISGAPLTAEAAIAALGPDLNDPDDEDACNRGFLREDALLVVTIIQDTYDEYSIGTVEEWIEALRAAKGYDDDAFAVLVLTTDIDVGYHQLCWPNEFIPVKNKLRLLAESVEHGFIGSICMESYAPFFAEHVGVLVDLCEDFVSPG